MPTIIQYAYKKFSNKELNLNDVFMEKTANN
jgi:hypothetical protein